MKEELFYILAGNNGASYIINCSDWTSLSYSLNFYKARTLRSKILKFGLKLFLFFNKQFSFKELNTITDIVDFLQKTVKCNNSFNLNNNCSVLVSPTRDKVIVNHHNEYFQKFAFAGSIQSVKKEKAVYELCGNSIKSFIVSDYFDEYEITDKLYSFKLRANIKERGKASNCNIDLVSVLLEFFALSSVRYTSIYKYLDAFSKSVELINDDVLNAKFSYYNNIDNESNKDLIPLGLVHKDFKPWNIILMNKPLVFDFEESVMNGLPLEDLFNYIIDPIIRYKPSSHVADIVFSNSNILLYNQYLKELKIDFNYKIFLDLYILERVVFWFNKDEKLTSDKFISLLEYIENDKWLSFNSLL